MVLIILSYMAIINPPVSSSSSYSLLSYWNLKNLIFRKYLPYRNKQIYPINAQSRNYCCGVLVRFILLIYLNVAHDKITKEVDKANEDVHSFSAPKVTYADNLFHFFFFFKNLDLEILSLNMWTWQPVNLLSSNLSWGVL